MQVNNAWYSKQCPTQLLIETTDGVRRLAHIEPTKMLYKTDLRKYYGHEVLDATQELPPIVLWTYGLDKVTLPPAIRVKCIRLRTDLSQAAFAARYHIPTRSVENWESGASNCPSYLIDLLEFRVSNDMKK